MVVRAADTQPQSRSASPTRRCEEVSNRSDRGRPQTVVEPLTEYCRTCGHAKETHNLNFRGDPNKAHELYGEGDYVCRHMTGAESRVHCICVGWSSWV